jgi:hypothetical protein
MVKYNPDHFEFPPQADVPTPEKDEPSAETADSNKFRIHDEIRDGDIPAILFAVATDIDDWRTARVLQRAYHDKLDSISPEFPEASLSHTVRLFYPDFPPRP